MNKINFKKITLVLSSSIVLLFLILVLHLVIVMKPKDLDNSTTQLSRIEFEHAPSENEISEIIPTLKNMDGVKIVKYYTETSYLVTAFDNTKIDNEKLIAVVKTKSSCQAKLFIPTAAMNAGACPVLGKNTFSYRLAAIIKGIFY